MAGPRPRRGALLFVAIAAAVSLIVLISEGGSASRPKAAELVQVYVDQVRPGVQRSADDGADLADIRANAAKLGRDGVDRRLDRLAKSVDSTLSDAEALTPPPSMRVPNAYLVATLGVRAKGVHEARRAFDAALTLTPAPDQGAQDAVDQLTALGQDLTLGDRAFALFVGSLPPNTGLPAASPWVANATDWSSTELPVFVALLRSTASLSAVHDLAVVAFQTDPPAVSTTADGTEVIPGSGTMSVSLVVQNIGNQPERQVTVSVVLALSNGSQQSLRDFVDLAPGQRRAIGPLQSLHPIAGTSGTLRVSVAPVSGQTDLSHNSITTPVQFR